MQYICDICNKGFNSKYNYNRHINNENIHNKIRDVDEYKYKCNCGKQYLHHSNLYTHQKQCLYIINNAETNVIDLKIQLENENEILNEILLKEREQFEIERQQFQKKEEELLKQLEHEKQRKTI